MPANRRPTIEINGRLYDAVTGQLLKNPSHKQAKHADSAEHNHVGAKPAVKNIPHTSGHSIDGFIGANVSQPSQKVSKEDSSKPPLNNSDAKEIQPPAAEPSQHRPRAASHIHHKSKRSQTLNRAVVTPPAAKPATHKAHTDSKITRPAKPDAAKGQLASQTHAARQARAAKSTKSAAISKYGSGQAMALPDQPAQSKNVTQPTTQSNAQPTVQPAAVSAKENLIARHLAAVAAQPSADKSNIKLSKRLGQWVSQKRTSSLLASSIAAVLLIGYITYLNVPRIALRVAAGRAGFEAEMPGYSPGGFAFSGPVAYSPGQISIQFSSNTDNRKYIITERETTWDSQTLLDNHVLGETDLYSTYQERGLTVYVYDSAVATWVNGGIWYTISGESSLTAEQLLKIASSL